MSNVQDRQRLERIERADADVRRARQRMRELEAQLVEACRALERAEREAMSARMR